MPISRYRVSLISFITDVRSMKLACLKNHDSLTVLLLPHFSSKGWRVEKPWWANTVTMRCIGGILTFAGWNTVKKRIQTSPQMVVAACPGWQVLIFFWWWKVEVYSRGGLNILWVSVWVLYHMQVIHVSGKLGVSDQPHGRAYSCSGSLPLTGRGHQVPWSSHMSSARQFSTPSILILLSLGQGLLVVV
jgi:hypothetical protein